MKVYIVSRSDYDWTETLKVYLKRELAETYVNGLFEEHCESCPYHRSKGWEHFWVIEEIEIEEGL